MAETASQQQANDSEKLAFVSGFFDYFVNIDPVTVKRNTTLALNQTDFRSFRTMHSSLMSSVGALPEVTRDPQATVVLTGYRATDDTQVTAKHSNRVNSTQMARANMPETMVPSDKQSD